MTGRDFVRPGEGTRIALPYRSSSPYSLAVQEAVSEAMRPAVSHRVTAKPSGRPPVTAGADEPERHPPDSIDGQQLVSLPDANTTDDNSVHVSDCAPRWSDEQRIAFLERARSA